MGIEQGPFSNPIGRVEKPKTTTEEDLKRLAELGEKALEEKDKTPSGQTTRAEVKLGKAFQTAETEPSVQPKEQVKEKEGDENAAPGVKLGKAFQSK